MKKILLTSEEKQQIFHDWNATGKEYSKDKTIQQIFEEQVIKTPNNTVIIYEDTRITYQELNNRANQLSNYLLNTYDIKPDTLIALCIDSSEYMLIAILAILKAGAAYVPMDPGYPDERIKYILENTNTKIVVTNELYQQRLQNISNIDNQYKANISILPIDNNVIQYQLSNQSIENPNISVTSNNLAYVIYTSGTTGNPKGVMIEHKGVVSLVKNVDYVDITPEDTFIQLSNIAFDAATFEIWGALLNGARLIVLSNRLALISDIDLFHNILVTNQISILFITKALFDQVFLLNKNIFENIKCLLVGGEALNKNLIEELLNTNSPPENFFNIYGPTENTTFSCALKLNKNNIKDVNSVPIGVPITNRKAYVLNNDLSLSPIGEIGELYVGGEGLARGYLNNPELTDEKFISNPFQTEGDKLDTIHSINGKNARLYKTGDLVRWLPEGNLEFIGRNDFQVKVRGYRIELGEIENALSNYGEIKQVVVLAKEQNKVGETGGGSKYLIGYYVSEKKLVEESIKKYLKNKLPEYMIPTALVHLEKLPLTSNGKIDRKALPDLEFIDDENYTAPRNELEAGVCKIWAEVLGLPETKVGINNDFFSLGGDSIVSIQIISKIKQRFKIAVSIKDIFAFKTIGKLYDNILQQQRDNNKEVNTRTEQGILSGEVSLLPIQEWFFESNFHSPHHWNQTFMIKTPNLDIDKLQLSINRLVEYHDAFKLRYKEDKDSKYVQYYDDKANIGEINILDIKSLQEEERNEAFESKLLKIITNWQCNFNLEDGPIHSVSYLYGYADGSSRICLSLHHLIVDTISWRILAEDLRDIYNDKDLGPKGSSYRQWVSTVKEYAIVNTAEKDYWTNLLIDHYPNNDLNKLVVSEDTRNYASLQLNQEQTDYILKESSKAYNTQINDILLTALAYSLSTLTDNKVNHITLEGHGREEIDNNVDISKTLGWFTTMYPIRLEIKDELGDSIKSIKESLRQVPNKGIGYGVLIGYKKKNLPLISFNYLGQFDKKNTEADTFWNIVNEARSEGVFGETRGVSVDINNREASIIHIDGLVIDNGIEFSITTKLDTANTDKIANLFKQNLENIIDYISDQNRTYLTVSDIDSIISQEYLDQLQKSREVEGVYLANSLHQGFIFHAITQGNIDNAYRVQLIWQYHTEIDISKLQEAWEYAQARYQSLRLRFAWDEELVQVIDKKGKLDWRYIDLRIEQDTNKEFKIKQIQEEDRKEPYKLEEGNLFRVYMIQEEENLYTCIFSSHHAIIDGWSNSVLLEYIHDTYLKLLENEFIQTKIDYSYENSQRYLQEHQNNSKHFWDKYIEQIEERSDLSGLLSISSKNENLRISEYKHITNPQEVVLKIKDDLYYGLKDVCIKQGVTLNAILQYVWHKILNIYGNSSQTVVGMTISGRTLPINDIEESVGLYINTLPLIVNHKNQTDKSIIESIRDIQDNINEINSRDGISLAELQRDGTRLFDSLFIFENYPNLINKEHNNKLKINFKNCIEKVDYPLMVMAHELDNQLIFRLTFANELFSTNIIENLLSLAKILLEQITINFNEFNQDLSYLNTKQYHQIISEWNQTDKEYPKDKTIYELFEEQVVKTSNDIAVVYEDTKLTYQELNEKANRLAHYLKETGNIQPDTLIALCLDRSEHTIIAILGVLKAGGAYIPMDPSYPNERIKYILEDTNTKIIITSEEYRKRLQSIQNINNKVQTDINILALDNTSVQHQLSNQSIINPSTSTTSKNLAYVIYTSGTTGNPKGVMIEHGSYIAFIDSFKSLYFTNINAISTYSITNYVFDIFGLEFGLPLFSGGRMEIGNSQFENIDCSNFTFIQMTPSMCDLKLNCLANYSNTRLIIGGEQLTYSLFNRIIKQNISFIHVYGPTETSIWSTSVQYSSNEQSLLSTVSLGRALHNEKCYILDGNMNPLPIGAIGELYIGGAGLARGYLNRSELTAERFVSNPFQTKEEKYDISYSSNGRNTRLYKTGDLVRWLPDGNIEYIGRNDFQVKIRGYRIELGEIESALSSYEGITHSVVLAKEHMDLGKTTENKYLVGYYISEQKLEEEQIINYLSSKLPEYMVPTVLVYLSSFPLTINGKLDRNALPDPELTNSDTYMPPGNEIEKKLCATWAEVLGLSQDKISINDDFFRLGGNSITAIKLTSKLHNDLDIIINLASIFKHSTITQLAKYLELNSQNSAILYTEEWEF